jgi:hypothetical protein
MGNSTHTRTHTRVKPVPVSAGMGLFGYGYGYHHIGHTATSSPTMATTTNHHPSSHINKAARKGREALVTQGDAGGMGYDSHPSQMVCYFDFLFILC